VGGTYQITQERGFEVFIRADKTAPEALKQVTERLASMELNGHTKGRTHTVSATIPLLENRDLVEIGFLTSAYLMWFRELGYSWALQEHLGPIRDQITHPTEAILPRNFLAPCPDQVYDWPWIGVGQIGGELALLAGLADRVVFLPPADARDFYNALGSDLEGLALDPRPLSFYQHHIFGAPRGVMLGHRLVIAPDVMMYSLTAGDILLFPADGGGPYRSHPVSQGEYERWRQAHNTVTTRHWHRLPSTETGRAPT
jgi:hypothetical protein